MSTESNCSADVIDKTLSILQEFYVEFFGMFLPGVVTVGLFFGLWVWVCRFLMWCHAAVPSVKYNLGVGWLNTTFMHEHQGLLVMFLLFLSYMVGAILYRREPKGPDNVSAYRQWKKAKGIEKKRLAVQFNVDEVLCSNKEKRSWLVRIWRGFRDPICGLSHDPFWKMLFAFFFNERVWVRRFVGNADMDFPYPHLRKFLLSRNLPQLANYVSWCGDAPKKDDAVKDSREGCSKHLINSIKHCILVSGCERLIADMIRNECHVRMQCSFWYCMNVVYRAGVVCAIGGVCGSLAVLHKHEGDLSGLFRVAQLMIVLYVLCYLRRTLVKCIHYIRTREVVTILEGAVILVKKNHDLYGALFQAFEDEAWEFRERVCLGSCPNKELCQKALQREHRQCCPDKEKKED